MTKFVSLKSKAFAAMFAAAGMLVAVSSHAQQSAASYPNKPIRMISGGIGGPGDILARLIGPKLTEVWGQPVVVDNRPAAAGTIGAGMVAKAAPDGYTLLLISGQFAITAATMPNLPYDSVKDFAGVTQIGFSTSVMVVHPSLGVKTVKDFIALANARPTPVLFSSGGAGSSTHFSGERFRAAAGIKATHVGFKSTPEALIEVLGNRVQYCIVGLGPAQPLIRDGRLVPIAVTTPSRSPTLPDVPAMTEILPTYGRDGSHSMMAPAGTPIEIRRKISREVGRILKTGEVYDRLNAQSYHVTPTTPEEHDRIIREQIESFAKTAKLIGLR